MSFLRKYCVFLLFTLTAINDVGVWFIVIYKDF